jgi:hypothetical protein
MESFSEVSYPFYPYTEFAVNTEDEWQQWRDENLSPDLTNAVVEQKERSFERQQKAIYVMLCEPVKSRTAFKAWLARALPEDFKEMTGGETKRAFDWYAEKKEAYHEKKATRNREAAAARQKVSDAQVAEAEKLRNEKEAAYRSLGAQGVASLAGIAALVLGIGVGLPLMFALAGGTAGASAAFNKARDGKCPDVVVNAGYALASHVKKNDAKNAYEKAKNVVENKKRARDADAAAYAELADADNDSEPAELPNLKRQRH